jgi:predicted dehydrogenase
MLPSFPHDKVKDRRRQLTMGRKRAMPETINVGVITHEQGPHLDLYLGALAQTKEAAGVVLADPSGQTQARAKKILGNKFQGWHKDYRDMLGKHKPAMALVTVEAALAPPAIHAALDAGCHVLSEKPGCVRGEDFEKLTRLAEQKHRHLMLALANRIHPTAREARRLIQKKTLGRIYAVEIHMVADQTRLTRESYRTAWYCRRARAGGGHLIWLGIHWLDLALLITGLHVQEVAAFVGVVGGQPIDVEDSAALALNFGNRTFGTMLSGYYLDRGYHSHVKVWGEHGWLRMALIEGEPLEWYNTRDGKQGKVQRFVPPKAERSYTPFVQAAVRASAGLEDAPITPAESLHVLKSIFAAYRAAQTGRTQKV